MILNLQIRTWICGHENRDHNLLSVLPSVIKIKDEIVSFCQIAQEITERYLTTSLLHGDKIVKFVLYSKYNFKVTTREIQIYPRYEDIDSVAPF